MHFPPRYHTDFALYDACLLNPLWVVLFIAVHESGKRDVIRESQLLLVQWILIAPESDSRGFFSSEFMGWYFDDFKLRIVFDWSWLAFGDRNPIAISQYFNNYKHLWFGVVEPVGFQLHFIGVASSVVRTAADVEFGFFFGWFVLQNDIQVNAWFVLHIIGDR